MPRGQACARAVIPSRSRNTPCGVMRVVRAGGGAGQRLEIHMRGQVGPAGRGERVRSLVPRTACNVSPRVRQSP